MNPKITGPELDEELRLRARFITLLVFILLLSLVMRLVHMQIFKGGYYEGLAQNNRIRIVSLKAPRGKILDRHGVVLADNRPAYNLTVMPKDIADPDSIATRLATLLEQDTKEIRQKIVTGLSRPYDPVYLARDITFVEMARIESEIFNLPGVSIEASTERDYVYKELASHCLGFLGEVSRETLKQASDGEYAPGDLEGKNGMERACETRLKGTKGIRIFEVDAIGRKIKVLSEHTPVPGEEVRLTIDRSLQVIAQDSLGERAGAVVAISPRTGEILALTSGPQFDPNMFLTPMAPEMWRQVIEDPLHPLENRALRGQYPPGSIFKVAVALAGLGANVITPQKAYYCSGAYTLGTNTYRCWKPTGHGEVSLRQALAEACDSYFYQLGEEVGIDTITRVASELGFGHPTGIELADEVSGLIPSREWKLRRFGKPWHPGETIITAIGQGFTLVTPLQVAKAMSSVVNGGYVYTPRLILSSPLRLERRLEVAPGDLDAIKEALRAVVEGEYGTGRGIRDPMFSVGGKTGTAQVARGYSSKLMDESDLPYKVRDHAWFFGFSPVESPEILVVAVVEHGGHGGSIAAPIVRDVIKGYYFLKGISDEQIFEGNR